MSDRFSTDMSEENRRKVFSPLFFLTTICISSNAESLRSYILPHCPSQPKQPHCSSSPFDAVAFSPLHHHTLSLSICGWKQHLHKACVIINKMAVQVKSSCMFWHWVLLSNSFICPLQIDTQAAFSGVLFQLWSLTCHLGGPILNAGPTSICKHRFAENILLYCSAHSRSGREGKAEETLHNETRAGLLFVLPYLER